MVGSPDDARAPRGFAPQDEFVKFQGDGPMLQLKLLTVNTRKQSCGIPYEREQILDDGPKLMIGGFAHFPDDDKVDSLSKRERLAVNELHMSRGMLTSSSARKYILEYLPYSHFEQNKEDCALLRISRLEDRTGVRKIAANLISPMDASIRNLAPKRAKLLPSTVKLRIY